MDTVYYKCERGSIMILLKLIELHIILVGIIYLYSSLKGISLENTDKIYIPIYGLYACIRLMVQLIRHKTQEDKNSLSGKEEEKIINKYLFICKKWGMEIRYYISGNHFCSLSSAMDHTYTNYEHPKFSKLMYAYDVNKDIPTIEKLTYSLIDLLYTILSTNDTISTEIQNQIDSILDEYTVTFNKVISSYDAMREKEQKEKEKLHEEIALPRIEGMDRILKNIQKDCDENLKKFQGDK